MAELKNDGFWVFGYGSLMWRPGFQPAERRRARLRGYRRRFCLRSVRYRGTPESPGLVLGLDHDASAECHGIAYRVETADARAVHAYLRARELITYAYLEEEHSVTLEDGRSVPSLCYVVDAAHEQYAGDLAPEAQAAIIAERAGPAGTNRAYLENTLAHLQELGVADPELEALAALVAAR